MSILKRNLIGPLVLIEGIPASPFTTEETMP